MTPQLYGEIEVPQILKLGDHWILLFCTHLHSDAQSAAGANWNGSHYFIAIHPTGPYELASNLPLLADERGSRYGARIVDDPWRDPAVLAWRRFDETGEFAGDIINPLAIEIDTAGVITLRT
jgi:hypothetical protein